MVFKFSSSLVIRAALWGGLGVLGTVMPALPASWAQEIILPEPEKSQPSEPAIIDPFGMGPIVPVRKGMTYAQVTQAMGGPSSRQEFESKREALWNYDSMSVRFKDGKVLDYNIRPGSRLYDQMEKARVDAARMQDDSAGAQNTVVEDIFNEIMKETP